MAVPARQLMSWSDVLMLGCVVRLVFVGRWVQFLWWPCRPVPSFRMQAATGSQWRSLSSGVKWENLSRLKIRHAAAFWLPCTTDQELHCVLCAERPDPADVVEGKTAVMFGVRDSLSSRITPRCLAVDKGYFGCSEQSPCSYKVEFEVF